MKFTKMHGIGNDYVYVNCFDVPLPKDPAALAVKIADYPLEILQVQDKMVKVVRLESPVLAGRT